MASAATNNLENKILWWKWIKWKQWQLFFCQRRHQSHGAGGRQQKDQNKQTKHYLALSETETKQCPLLAPAIEENSCLCRQILFFFFSFSCNWTLQTTGCSSPAETQAYTRDCAAAKSKGVSWPFRLAVTGALSRGQEITLMLFHPRLCVFYCPFPWERIWYKHLLSTAEYHIYRVQGETKAFSK